MEFFIPRLRMEGISEEVIQKILVENPRRILAFDA
jgi:predicted metal-dependent phosphotriesterase family hydrolase